MKKYLFLSLIVILLVFGINDLIAKASPSIWSVFSTGQNRTATSTDKTTVGLQVNTTLTSPILMVDGFTQVDMNIQVGVATNTAASLPTIIATNYFSTNGSDWFPETLSNENNILAQLAGFSNGSTTIKIIQWDFSTTTSETGQIIGNSVYLNRHFSVKNIGSRFMKTVFKSTIATSTIYADFTISNPNKN